MHVANPFSGGFPCRRRWKLMQWHCGVGGASLVARFFRVPIEWKNRNEVIN
jgi:hypothetical protein